MAVLNGCRQNGKGLNFFAALIVMRERCPPPSRSDGRCFPKTTTELSINL